MASGYSCKNCNSSNIDIDVQRGDTVCTNCGSVLEAKMIVSEVQFEETAHGGSRAVGQLVNPEAQAAGSYSMGLQLGMSQESRNITISKARRKIVELSEQLRLSQQCQDMAIRFYRTALDRRLTRGRRSSHIVAACIYLACRILKTSHMLLDLSDIVQVNVYELGRTYLHLASSMCLNIPALDPCLYIARFAHRLEFEDKTLAVMNVANRLVHRMKTDWMHTGRRPSGLCGAALLVAARLNGFNRTVKDIIKVVKVCETTVRKRLTEFGDTPSSQLTQEEFMSIDLEEQQDPPSFKLAKKKKVEDQGKGDEVVTEISQLAGEIEKVLSERKTRLGGFLARFAQFTPQDESEIAGQLAVEETLESVNSFVGNNDESIDDILLPEQDSRVAIAGGMGLKESIEECLRSKTNDEPGQETDGHLDLTGIDDEEIDAIIMTTEETKVKTTLWMGKHSEFLEMQKEKQLQKAKEEEENAKKPDQPKKRKRHVRKKGGEPAQTAGEAIEKMLQEKKLSRKINYEALKNLGASSVAHQVEPSTVSPFFAAVHLTSPLSSHTSSRKTPPPSPFSAEVESGMKKIVEKAYRKAALEEEPLIIDDLEDVDDPKHDDDEEENDDEVEKEEKDEGLSSVSEVLAQYGGEREGDDYDYDDE